MGFATRVSGKLVTQEIPRPANALLILIHSQLAPTPRIVRLEDLFTSPSPTLPFWKLLGIREEKTVREILHEAEVAGLINKYATVDQLEQITTAFSFGEYLERK